MYVLPKATYQSLMGSIRHNRPNNQRETISAVNIHNFNNIHDLEKVHIKTNDQTTRASGKKGENGSTANGSTGSNGVPGSNGSAYPNGQPSAPPELTPNGQPPLPPPPPILVHDGVQTDLTPQQHKGVQTNFPPPILQHDGSQTDLGQDVQTQTNAAAMQPQYTQTDDYSTSIGTQTHPRPSSHVATQSDQFSADSAIQVNDYNNPPPPPPPPPPASSSVAVPIDPSYYDDDALLEDSRLPFSRSTIDHRSPQPFSRTFPSEDPIQLHNGYPAAPITSSSKVNTNRQKTIYRPRQLKKMTARARTAALNTNGLRDLNAGSNEQQSTPTETPALNRSDHRPRARWITPPNIVRQQPYLTSKATVGRRPGQQRKKNEKKKKNEKEIGPHTQLKKLKKIFPAAVVQKPRSISESCIPTPTKRKAKKRALPPNIVTTRLAKKNGCSKVKKALLAGTVYSRERKRSRVPDAAIVQLSKEPNSPVRKRAFKLWQ
jgi:hypothetical protein